MKKKNGRFKLKKRDKRAKKIDKAYYAPFFGFWVRERKRKAHEINIFTFALTYRKFLVVFFVRENNQQVEMSSEFVARIHFIGK